MGFCRICRQNNEDEYMTSNGYYCKSCYKRKYHSGPKKPRKNEWEPPSYNNQLPNEPGVFYDREQEKYVHDILRSMGWNKTHKGNWYDNKLRDKEGNWLIKIPKQSRFQKGSPSKYSRYLIKQLDSKIPYISYHSREPYFTQQQIRDIQEKYFLERYSSSYLIELYECDEKEVLWVIQMTYKRIRDLMKYNETDSRTNKST